jgi:hypothetical protein
MQTQDTSQAARIALLRNRVLSGFQKLNPKNPPDSQTQDRSVLIHQQIRSGNSLYYRQSECGVIIPSIPCGCTQKCVDIPLDTIATYLRNYMTEFRNPNFYVYSCDPLDSSGYYIEDGGNDMFDGANFTTPWLLSGDIYVSGNDEIIDYPGCVSYLQTNSAVTDTDFNYISLGCILSIFQVDSSRHPLTIMGYRCSGPVGWQVGGNIGADGRGIMISNILYSGSSINGFTVHAGYRQVYNADVPVVCNLVILLGRSEWYSTFGPINIYADTSTSTNGFYFYTGAGSANILAIHILLSKTPETSTTPISNSDLRKIISKITKRIAESL